MNLVEIQPNPGGSQAMPSTSMVKMERVMEWRKRRLEDDEGSPETKRSRMNVYIRLESESSIASDNDTESIYSIQDKETDVVQDTSDTDIESNLSDSDLEVDLDEYDVASLVSEHIFTENCSSSGTEDFHASAGAIAAVLCDSSLEKWITDVESSDNSSAEDVNTSFMDTRKDFRTCIQCKSDTSYLQLCQKCFQIRKTFFPPRPRGYRKRRRVERKIIHPKVKLDTLKSWINNYYQDSSQPSYSQDSGIGSSQEIQNLELNRIIIPARSKRTLSQEDLFEPPCKIQKVEIEDDVIDRIKSEDEVKSSSDSDSKSTVSTVINVNVETKSEDEGSKRELFSSSSGIEKNSSSDSDTQSTSVVINLETKSGDERRKGGSFNSSSSIDKISSSNFNSESISTVNNMNLELKSGDEGGSFSSTGVEKISCSDSEYISSDVNTNRETKSGDEGSKVESFSTSSASEKISSSDEMKKEELCIICNSLPKNGIFLHGSIAHMCCCYKCAVKTWRTNKRCPVCNCKVKNIVKLYTS